MSVEAAIIRLSAVKNVLVNLVHGSVLVEVDTDKLDQEQIANAVEKVGYNVSAHEDQEYKTDADIFNLNNNQQKH